MVLKQKMDAAFVGEKTQSTTLLFTAPLRNHSYCCALAVEVCYVSEDQPGLSSHSLISCTYNTCFGGRQVVVTFSRCLYVYIYTGICS